MVELTIRVSICGKYENTITEYAEENSDHNDEIMKVAREAVENDYGDSELWDDGEVSWTVEW